MNSWREVVHVELIDNLIEVGIVWRSDVDEFPIKGSRKSGEALEGDVEGEPIESSSWVVPDTDIVDVNLSHLAPLSSDMNMITNEA